MTKSELIKYLRERGSISGVCIQGVWTWIDRDGERVNRAANALLKSGEAKAMYFSGGKASLSLAEGFSVQPTGSGSR